MLTQGHDKSADYWAFGILLYELLCGITPFEARSEQRTFEKIVHAQKYLSFYPGFDPHCKSLIRRLLHPNPALRIGALQGGIDDVKKHAFFVSQNLNFESLLNQEVEMPYIPELHIIDDSITGTEVDVIDLTEEVEAVDDEFYSYFAEISV